MNIGVLRTALLFHEFCPSVIAKMIAVAVLCWAKATPIAYTPIEHYSLSVVGEGRCDDNVFGRKDEIVVFNVCHFALLLILKSNSRNYMHFNVFLLWIWYMTVTLELPAEPGRRDWSVHSASRLFWRLGVCSEPALLCQRVYGRVHRTQYQRNRYQETRRWAAVPLAAVCKTPWRT